MISVPKMMRRVQNKFQHQRFSKLTHIDSNKLMPKMVDISAKTRTNRTAHAQALVTIPYFGDRLKSKTTKTVSESDPMSNSWEIQGPKGPVFSTAVVCGVMAAKKTSSLIPFCHQISLEKCDIDVKLVKEAVSSSDSAVIQIDCVVGTSDKTGVEMEAMVGASAAALCVYDMLKALTHGIEINRVILLSKTGGKEPYNLSESVTSSQ